MPQYLSPGVYVEEIKPKAQTIAGVGTSTAGFIGVVPSDVKMPDQPGLFEIDDTTKKPKLDAKGNPIPIPYTVAKAGESKLITSWEEFKNNFGDFQAKKEAPTGGTGGPGSGTPSAQGWAQNDYDAYRYLQHAVYGFFNNGGTRCWVMRVAASGELASVADDLEKFAAIDEIALVIVPGATVNTQQTDILAHCFKLQDRFAILDGVQNPATVTADAIAPTGRSETGSYGAIYFPWIKVFDPATNQIIAVPPSGHIAGIYARSDSTRGVFKAPANEVVVGALDVDRPLSKANQDGLNPEGINVIRSFNGSIKVWGARTRTDEANSQYRYVSTRRYFNFLRESIDEGTQFVVFEPNTPALWQRITQTVSGFLLNQWRDGALFGTTPEQAFFVKCDKDTNPDTVRDLGQVVTEIGVAIVKPAEFVIFRIQQISGS
jgi:hypothetical protein